MITWVFLRGLTREARHWGDFLAQFRAAVPVADIVCPDLPGNGSLVTSDSPTHVGAVTEQVRATLQGMGRPPPYALLGLSLGGMVAADWATRHADEVSRLVLINTSLRPYCPFYRRLRPTAWPALCRVLWDTAAETREYRILRLTSQMAGAHAAVLPNWVAYRLEYPVSRRNALRQLWAASRFQAQQAPEVPILVLAGGQDRLVDPTCSQSLAAAWGAELAVHPVAGHDLPLDDGEWVAAQVRDWVARRGRDSEVA